MSNKHDVWRMSGSDDQCCITPDNRYCQIIICNNIGWEISIKIVKEFFFNPNCFSYPSTLARSVFNHSSKTSFWFSILIIIICAYVFHNDLSVLCQIENRERNPGIFLKFFSCIYNILYIAKAEVLLPLFVYCRLTAQSGATWHNNPSTLGFGFTHNIAQCLLLSPYWGCWDVDKIYCLVY